MSKEPLTQASHALAVEERDSVVRLLQSEPTGRVLRLPEVENLVGLSRTTIYRLMHSDFPLPVKLGLRAVAWREADIVAWLASRPTVRMAA